MQEDVHFSGETAYQRTLQQVQDLGVSIETIIDVGSSNGPWSFMAKEIIPDAHCHLIEANPHWKSSLEWIVSEYPDFSFVMAAAGPEDGEIQFSYVAEDPYSGYVSLGDSVATTISVPMITIDKEVERLNLKPPYLIKLDTHGFERGILKGASRTLRQTALLVTECYNIMREEDRRFPEMVQFYEGLGLKCIQLVAPMFRPFDDALWQFDLAFLDNRYLSDQSHDLLPDPGSTSFLQTTDALRRITRRGIEVASIIDVGGGDGSWSRMAQQILPEARIHIIETDSRWRASLEMLSQQDQKFSYSIGEPSIDEIVSQFKLRPPYLIRINIPDQERQILASAKKTLRLCHLLVARCYNFPDDPRQLFAPMVQFYEGLGFRTIDMAEIVQRPSGKAMWSLDFFFVSAKRPEANIYDYDKPTWCGNGYWDATGDQSG